MKRSLHTPKISEFFLHLGGRLLLTILCCSIYFVHAQPITPKFQTFQPVTSTNPGLAQSNTFPRYGNPVLLNNTTEQQNLQLMQQGGMTLPGPSKSKRQQLAELKRDLKEDETRVIDNKRAAWSASYQKNLQQFLQLNPDSFSVTQAVYLSESAWYDNPPSFREFETTLKQEAAIVKQILKREGLSEKNNTAINYGIQKLYTQSNNYYNVKEKASYSVPRIGYDFNDYMGDKDWTKMFVTKLLQTGKGQCHSMPLHYLCVAEQLHGNAWLSLSPNHSFIQFFDQKGNRYNFETTNGKLVTQGWLMQSNYINATAFKNKTYLDTLSSRKLYGQCLSDLLLGYLMKVGYDNVSRGITQRILAVDSSNITALMTQANLATYIFQSKVNQYGNPPQKEFPRFPELNQAYQAMEKSYQQIAATGFQEMPQEAYQRWLKSLQMEKQKDQNRQEKERMQREIEQLKKTKSTLINEPKG